MARIERVPNGEIVQAVPMNFEQIALTNDREEPVGVFSFTWEHGQVDIALCRFCMANLLDCLLTYRLESPEAFKKD